MEGEHNRDKFIKELERNSTSPYPLCIKEWTEAFREYDCENSECICGKKIKEVITIRNLKNGKRLEVGNVCINQFGKGICSCKCVYCGEKMRKPKGRDLGLCSECKRNRIVKFGKYKGKTLLWLITNDSDYIKWLESKSYSSQPWALALFSYLERMKRNYWSLAETIELDMD